jgi:N-acetylglucosaminyl-diphospho-decaprenol L-rhamnosyltransferase
MTSPQITLSIVSHAQGPLIRSLLSDLALLPQQNFEVIITVNVPEDETHFQGYPFPLTITRNLFPKGFGSNHNAAFGLSSSRWFAVVNPDIRISNLDLEDLIAPFQNPSIVAVAPVVLSPDGNVEDSARRFPTLARLAKRAIFGRRDLDYQVGNTPCLVDWVAGMFIVFRREAFRDIGGFDAQRFFMYMEDADICRRIHDKGWKVAVNPDTKVTHMAQRASHSSLKHMRWHAVSAFRFLTGW